MHLARTEAKTRRENDIGLRAGDAGLYSDRRESFYTYINMYCYELITSYNIETRLHSGVELDLCQSRYVTLLRNFVKREYGLYGIVQIMLNYKIKIPRYTCSKIGT